MTTISELNPPSLYHVFEIQVPGFPLAIFKIPKGLSDEEWEFLLKTQSLYLERYREFEKENKEVEDGK